jgi:hypothetical protein
MGDFPRTLNSLRQSDEGPDLPALPLTQAEAETLRQAIERIIEGSNAQPPSAPKDQNTAR